MNSSNEITQWVDMYAEKLLKQACFLLSDKEEAEDIVQEVFLTAFVSIDKFQRKSNPLTWLKSILTHKIADFYRNKYKFQQVNFDYFFDEEGLWKDNEITKEWEDNETSLGTLLDDKEFKNVLEKCFEKLPEKWSILVKMGYLEEKKSNEICQEMQISNTNYWKILQRSRLQLRKCLELNWFDR